MKLEGLPVQGFQRGLTGSDSHPPPRENPHSAPIVSRVSAFRPASNPTLAPHGSHQTTPERQTFRGAVIASPLHCSCPFQPRPRERRRLLRGKGHTQTHTSPCPSDGVLSPLLWCAHTLTHIGVWGGIVRGGDICEVRERNRGIPMRSRCSVAALQTG